jgi:hypothetical protein
MRAVMRARAAWSFQSCQPCREYIGLADLYHGVLSLIKDSLSSKPEMPEPSRLAAARTGHKAQNSPSTHELIAGVTLEIEQGREIGVVHPRIRLHSHDRLRAVGDA